MASGTKFVLDTDYFVADDNLNIQLRPAARARIAVMFHLPREDANLPGWTCGVSVFGGWPPNAEGQFPTVPAVLREEAPQGTGSWPVLILDDVDLRYPAPFMEGWVIDEDNNGYQGEFGPVRISVWITYG